MVRLFNHALTVELAAVGKILPQIFVASLLRAIDYTSKFAANMNGLT